MDGFQWFESVDTRIPIRKRRDESEETDIGANIEDRIGATCETIEQIDRARFVGFPALPENEVGDPVISVAMQVEGLAVGQNLKDITHPVEVTGEDLRSGSNQAAEAADRAGGCPVERLRVAKTLQYRSHNFGIALSRSALRCECFRPYAK